VDVVPLEGHGKRDDVELADRRLRLECQERRFRGGEPGQLLLRRQEETLADDVVLAVEEAVDRLETEVRHPDPIGVGECQGNPQTTAVRLFRVADFFSENLSCVLALSPGVHGWKPRTEITACARTAVAGCAP